MRWITVGPAGQPGTSIVLHPPAASPGVTDDERRTIAEMIRIQEQHRAVRRSQS
jgi:hypothetical protein